MSNLIIGQRGNSMNNPLSRLFPKNPEPDSFDEEQRKIQRELEINALKAKNKEKADEAAEAIRKLTTLIEKEGISGVFFIATGAERRGRKK